MLLNFKYLKLAQFFSLVLLVILGIINLTACGNLTATPGQNSGITSLPEATATLTPAPLPGGFQESYTTPAPNGHYGQIYALAISGDSKVLASGGSDHTIRLWDSSSGKLLKTIAYPRKIVSQIALNPTGNMVATVAQQEQWIQLWDAGSGQETRTLKGHTQQVRALAFSPDGKFLASVSDDKVGKIWDLSSGKILAELVGATTSLTYSSDGSLLLTGYRETKPDSPFQLTFWDTKTWQQLNTIRATSGFYSNSLVISLDNRYLAASSGDGFPVQESQVKVWERASGKEVFSNKESYLSVSRLLFSQDSSRLFVVGNKTSWITFNHETGETGNLPTDSFNYHGYARAWEISSGKGIMTLDRDDSFDSVAISPDGGYLATAQNSSLVFYDANTAKELRRADGVPTFQTVALSSDGKFLARTEGEKMVRILELAGGKEVAVLKSPERAFKSVNFSPDGKYLASGGWDGIARLWEVSSGKELRLFSKHANWINAVAFSPDGKTLATAGSDMLVKLWEVSSGKETAQLDGHLRAVWSLSFSPDGKYLASGGFSEYKSNNGLIIWEIARAKKHPTTGYL